MIVKRTCSKYFIIFFGFLSLLLITPIVNIIQIYTIQNSKDSYLKNQNITLNNADVPSFGDVQIFNVTLEKTMMEVGESIIVNASYKMLLNEGWSIDHIYLGILNINEYLCVCLPRIEGTYVNVSKKYYFDPDDINISTDYYGFLEIVIYNKTNVGNKVTFLKKSDDKLIFEKAFVDYELIYQYPEIIFSQDQLNLSFEFFNINNRTFKYKNKLIHFNLTDRSYNVKISQIKYTDSNGIIKLLLNMSEAGAGNFTLYFYFLETERYRSDIFSLKFYVYNETESFYCIISNNTEIFTDIGLDDAYSRIKLDVFCDFDANITCNSVFGNASLEQIYPNHFIYNISTPKQAGNYTIEIIAVPHLPGRNLIISKNINVKKRPLLINTELNRPINSQKKLDFHINLLDNLTGSQIIGQNICIYYFNDIQKNWTLIANFNISKYDYIFRWEYPTNFNNSQLKFKIFLENNSIFHSKIIFKNISTPIITSLIKEKYPLSTKINLIFQLSLPNGLLLKGENISVKILGKNWTLQTNDLGIFNISFLTPSYITDVKIIIEYNGNSTFLPLHLEFLIKIRRDSVQTFEYYSGYIFMFIILFGITVICLKTFRKPTSIHNLKVK